MDKDGKEMRQPPAVRLVTKSCGEKHTDHDWGQDGRCRCCGTSWACPPHWWTIENNVGRCRFCPAECDGRSSIKFFDDGKEFRNIMTFSDRKWMKKALKMVDKRRRQRRGQGSRFRANNHGDCPKLE